ncbi:DUF6760 family protein [Rhodobacter capsulatus]
MPHWRGVVADIAFAFHWSHAEILSLPWDEMLAWQAEIRSLYKAMSPGK